MFCQNCGAPIADGAKFCANCGAPAGAVQTGPAAQPAPRPETAPARQAPYGGSLVGFSNRINSPEFQAAEAKINRTSGPFKWILTFAPLVIFPIIGLVSDDFEFSLALTVGAVVTVVMLIFNLTSTAKKKKKPWDGVVVDKTVEHKHYREDNRDINKTYYRVFFRTDSGQSKKSEEIIDSPFDRGAPVYSYLSIGDRVRFHPKFDYYEKYDKSRDSAIPCALCHTMNSIENERCAKCGAPLLK